MYSSFTTFSIVFRNSNSTRYVLSRMFFVFFVCISCVTPAGTSNKPDIRNNWEENTHTPTATMMPSCLWTVRIFPSLPGSRLRFFIALQVQHSYTLSTNEWLNFFYSSRSHAFRQNKINHLMKIRTHEIRPINIRILLFCPPVGYFFIYPTTWISRQKTRLVTVHA